MNWVDEIFNTEPKADAFQLDMIEDLLKTSIISPERNEQISQGLDSLTYPDAEKLIEYLQNKQVNRIHAGLNYNATYVKWFLKKTI
jgi:SOS-response transcriptional repressor LexA